jgi:hypothetical protein
MKKDKRGRNHGGGYPKFKPSQAQRVSAIAASDSPSSCATKWRTNVSTNQPMKKKARPPFVPTRQEREFVSQMACMHLTVTDICLVIGISRRTLYKYFRPELEAGSARLHATTTSQFYKALKAGAPWAIQCALRNFATLPLGSL